MSNDTAFLEALLQQYAQTRGGVRERNQRLKQATTCAESAYIAAETQQRSQWYHLPSSIETAYHVLGAFARRHIEEREGVHHG